MRSGKSHFLFIFSTRAAENSTSRNAFLFGVKDNFSRVQIALFYLESWNFIKKKRNATWSSP